MVQSAGTKEGLVIDTENDSMWIFNRNRAPVKSKLGIVQFDHWP